MKPRRLLSTEVLCFSQTPRRRTTVADHYRRWRSDNELPEKCDSELCHFNSNPLIWNGSQLKLIVDHLSGNRNDNRHSNLRLLCPNCDSQQVTRGGSNIGRIQKQTVSGYEVAHRDGKRDANVFLSGVSATTAVGEITANGNTKDA